MSAASAPSMHNPIPVPREFARRFIARARSASEAEKAAKEYDDLYLTDITRAAQSNQGFKDLLEKAERLSSYYVIDMTIEKMAETSRFRVSANNASIRNLRRMLLAASDLRSKMPNKTLGQIDGHIAFLLAEMLVIRQAERRFLEISADRHLSDPVGQRKYHDPNLESVEWKMTGVGRLCEQAAEIAAEIVEDNRFWHERHKSAVATISRRQSGIDQMFARVLV